MSGDAEFEALGTMFQERNIKDLGGLQKTFVFLDPETRGTPIKLHLTSSAHTLDSAASANRSKYKSLWNYQVTYILSKHDKYRITMCSYSELKKNLTHMSVAL